MLGLVDELDRRPPGRRPRRRRPPPAARRRPSPSCRARCGPGARATAAARSRRSTSPLHTAVADVVRDARDRRPARRCPRRRRRRPRRGPGRDGGAVRASACNVARIADARRAVLREPVDGSCVCVDPDLLTTVENVCDRGGRAVHAASAWPAATGSRSRACSTCRSPRRRRGLARPPPGRARRRHRPGLTPRTERRGRTGRGGRAVRWPGERAGRWSRRSTEPPAGVDRSRAASPDDDTPKEACGVFGVFAPGQPVAHLTYLGLYALQHRGQESAGHGGQRRRRPHRGQGHGPRVQRVRRPHPRRPHRPPRHRPHPLLHHRLEHVAQRPAGLPRRRRPHRSPSPTTATSSTPRSSPTRPACCPAPSPATATSWPS